MRRARARGFILLPVVITALLVAALVALMRFQSLAGSHRQTASRERERAEYVLDAALTDAELRAERASCGGYSLPATAFGSDQYAASYVPTSGSPVTITATATLVNGTTRTARRAAVVVHDANARQLTLQPDELNGIDTYLDNSKADKNFGADGKLAAQQGKTRSLLAFDLSALPRGVRIVSAQLELFGSASQSVGATLYPMVHGWLEGACGSGSGGAATGGNTVTAGATKTTASSTTLAVGGSSGACVQGVGATWNSYDGSGAWQTSGGDFGAAVTATATVSTTQGFYQWEIGPLVREWARGERVNDGLILRATGGGIINMASSDDATASHRPRLVINYRCECGKSC